MMKLEVDQTAKTETSSPNLERNSGSAAENGETADLATSMVETAIQPKQQVQDSLKLEGSLLSEAKGALTEEAGESRDVVLPPTKEEVNFLKKEATAVRLDDDNREDLTVMSTATETKL